jgi:hypothetical protein
MTWIQIRGCFTVHACALHKTAPDRFVARRWQSGHILTTASTKTRTDTRNVFDYCATHDSIIALETWRSPPLWHALRSASASASLQPWRGRCAAFLAAVLQSSSMNLPLPCSRGNLNRQAATQLSTLVQLPSHQQSRASSWARAALGTQATLATLCTRMELVGGNLTADQGRQGVTPGTCIVTTWRGCQQRVRGTSLIAAKRVKKMDASRSGSASRSGMPVSRPADQDQADHGSGRASSAGSCTSAGDTSDIWSADEMWTRHRAVPRWTLGSNR